MTIGRCCRFSALFVASIQVEIPMAADPHDPLVQRQALQDLARELNLHVGEVVDLYEASLARLAAKAKVDQFLHVFAMREVQDRLNVHARRQARDQA